MFDFSNKNILIVGASSGIGEKTAYVLSELGANVILVARREERLKEVCNNIKSENKSYYICDVNDSDSIEGLVKKVVDEKGKLDGMVYTAGVTCGYPLKFLTVEKQIETFKTNYFGFVEFVRQVTKKSNYNRGLRIVSVSSVASIKGSKAHIGYAASKAAMDSAIRCIAIELYNKGICINSVAPAMINTDMYHSFLEGKDDKEAANNNIVSRQYLGLGETKDVASSIAFLLSQEARFITGITLPVDGGYTTT